MDLVNVEKEKEQRRLQLQKAASSGLSNIKKLKSLTKRKEELSRSASELDDVIDQKRQQFSQLLKRVSGEGSTAVPAKKQRRSPTHVSLSCLFCLIRDQVWSSLQESARHYILTGLYRSHAS